MHRNQPVAVHLVTPQRPGWFRSPGSPGPRSAKRASGGRGQRITSACGSGDLPKVAIADKLSMSPSGFLSAVDTSVWGSLAILPPECAILTSAEYMRLFSPRRLQPRSSHFLRCILSHSLNDVTSPSLLTPQQFVRSSESPTQFTKQAGPVHHGNRGL